jgi:hypothetical protein
MTPTTSRSLTRPPRTRSPSPPLSATSDPHKTLLARMHDAVPGMSLVFAHGSLPTLTNLFALAVSDLLRTVFEVRLLALSPPLQRPPHQS